MVGLYENYKKATGVFLDWLKTKSSSPVRSLKSIFQAAQRVKEKSIAVPKSVFDALNLAIELRTRVEGVYARRGEADEGHENFNRLLKLVSRVLKKNQQPSAAPSAPDEKQSNRFEGLRIEDDGAESDDGNEVDEVTELPAWLEDEESGAADMAELQGANMFFQAACLLLDLEQVVRETEKAWKDFRDKKCDHLTATALTNACLCHAERQMAIVELEWPVLDTLERVATAAYCMPVVLSMQEQFDVRVETALSIVSDIIFGDPSDTKITTLPGQARWLNVQGFMIPYLREDPNMFNFLSPQLGPVSIKNAIRRARKQGLKGEDSVIEYCIFAVADFAIRRFRTAPLSNEQDLVERDDFLLGDNGLLWTSKYLSKIKPYVTLNWPTWPVSKPGFCGDESIKSPTADMFPYLMFIMPSVLGTVKFELGHEMGGKGSGGSGYGFDEDKFQFPVYKMMPLWRIMDDAMRKEKLTLATVLSFHLLLLSLSVCDGDRRCERLKVVRQVSLSKMDASTSLASTAFDKNIKKYRDNAVMCVKSFRAWLDWESALEGSMKKYVSPGRGLPPGMSERFVQSLDEALFFNPYVSGQRQLVLHLGFNISHGVVLLDCSMQLSLTLHIYNAMKTVGLIGQLELLEVLMKSVGKSEAIFFAGVPSSNFVKHWFHRTGMSADMEKQRALSPLQRDVVSEAFSSVASGVGSSATWKDDPFLAELQRVREAFAADNLKDLDLIALSAELMRLPELLIEASGLQDAMQERIREDHMEGLSSNVPSQKIQGSKWLAILRTVTCEVLMWCDRKMRDKDVPFLVPQGVLDQLGLPGVSGSMLPPLQPHEEARLSAAGSALTNFIKGLKVKAVWMESTNKMKKKAPAKKGLRRGFFDT